MAEKGVRGGICQAIHRCAKANNKYMKNYDQDKESYIQYLDANNLYGWAMSQKLPVNGFKQVEELSQFNKDFITNYDENSSKGYFLEVDVEYLKNLFSRIAFNLHSDLPFLPERKKNLKCNNLVCNIHNKEKYVAHIRALKRYIKQFSLIKKNS